MERKADRHDLLLATALSVLTILSRLPYRARMLYNWDSVQFALALREYDVVKHQPHPPGYILYVGLGRLVDRWLDDPAAAYVFLAVAFSGLTTFVVYFLARAVYDRPTALAAATLLAVSPLFRFYGSVGLTYAGEALCASTVAYFAFRALRGSETDAWLAAGYLGLAGGLRQSILVLLFPLWLVGSVVGVRRTRTVALGLLILAVAVLTWFVPMVWLTGGLARYLEASRDLAESVVKPTSIVGSPLDVTVRMSRYLLESVLVGLGPLALAALLVPWYVLRHGWGRREWFLLTWVIPPVLVFTLVHFGQAGYVLTFLPALVILLSRILLAALGDAVLVAPFPRARAVATVAAVVGVVLVNGSFFVSARPLPRDFDSPRPQWVRVARDEAFDWIFSRTAAALREHEEVVRTFVDAIRGLYDAGDTVVITEVGNARSYPWLRHAMFYLPEYAIYELRVGPYPPGFYAPRRSAAMTRLPGSELRLPRSVKRLVWFVDHWNPAAARPAGLVEMEIPYGRYLYVLPVGRRPVSYGEYTFVRDEPPRERRARTR
ncbi:MAG: glycosyltransferase family 39 protein [Candidatus Rokubacteria bacterium]|nr:glycosyltransferase family 39 protein [Candidatus Rokubacteria bacterium]